MKIHTIIHVRVSLNSFLLSLITEFPTGATKCGVDRTDEVYMQKPFQNSLMISFVALKVVTLFILTFSMKNELKTIGSPREIITVENARRLLYF